ncbi:unnamed protein product [marine sediment metagenome]|uniref:Uncharacterized protein n=1 Tax=marine sediment metagenome TaxID=412755 RepID=X1QNQ1_9ZZZZ
MAFSWTENISKGTKIDAANLLEIRTNIDTVDDEKCAAHKVSYDSDDKDGDDTTYNPGYKSSQNTTVLSSHCPGYCPQNYSAALYSFKINVCLGYDSGV